MFVKIESRRIDREGPQHSGAQSPVEHATSVPSVEGRSHLPCGRSVTDTDLGIGLNHVEGVDDSPGYRTRRPAGQQGGEGRGRRVGREGEVSVPLKPVDVLANTLVD